MNSIPRLSTLSADPEAFASYLQDLEKTDSKGFSSVETFLEQCVALDADPEQAAKHLAKNPNGQLAFLLSENRDRDAEEFLYSSGLTQRDMDMN